MFVDAFEQYCDVKVQLDKLRKFRDENGYKYVTMGRHGEQHKNYPEIAQLNQCITQFQQWCTHFGLTPATEARFNDAQGDLFEDNPFGQLPGTSSKS
jgi:phage terminase small subunit